MSYKTKSASNAGHFTANETWRNGHVNQLDSYLMMLANRSFPLVRRPSSKHTTALVDWAERFKIHNPVLIGRTLVSLASGELHINEHTVSLRAINALNGYDTIHRISTESCTTNEGLIMPMVTVQRIALPKQVAEIEMTDLHCSEIKPLSNDTVYNPELSLSVIRAAQLLCEFA